MKQIRSMRLIVIASLVVWGSALNADAVSDWFNQLGQNINNEVIRPTEKAFVQLGDDINREVIQPAGKAFAKLGDDINKEVIQPIDFNVVKPIVGIGDTIGNIVSMAILIKGMIGPLQQTVATITKQVDSLASIKKGADVVDPIFIILRELTTLPPHFQAVLDKIAGSMSSIEDIVRPSSARDAEKIRQAGLAIASISKSVDEMTRKIAHLNRLLHVRVKSIAQSADEMTAQIIEVVK